MEFCKKLQELRKQKGLTQEELAESLYVSRTAISKWESGRGYPNIDSIKEISTFFNITIDELLSTNQMLVVAEDDKRETKIRFNDLVFGLLDLCVALLLFLPFFAVEINGEIENFSLINIYGVQQYLKITYFCFVFLMILVGVLFLSLQNFNIVFWKKSKITISLILGVCLVILFIISKQPYVAFFAFVLLVIKTLTYIKYK